jgi:hypothetical protein
LRNDGLARLIYLRHFILRFFFGHEFEYLFGCVMACWFMTKGPLG